MSDELFYVVMVLFMFFIAFTFGCLLNPLFWQALRNSKWIDEMKKDSEVDKLIEPKEEE